MNILVIGGNGYIGTKLVEHLLERGHDVSVCDLNWFWKVHDSIAVDYNKLSKEFLSKFDVIILLAGHSSVKMCLDNMVGSFKNNVVNFIDLLTNLSTQKFIYASSSSIYGNINRSLMDEECQEYCAGNFYDLSKYEIDKYVGLYKPFEYYGLRFGTVNGPSRNFRTDVMINAMYMSSVEHNQVKINNPNIRRPILGIYDLCAAVETIIDNGSPDKSGIYNLASFNSTVELIGRHVADYMNSELVFMPNSTGVYDFAISTLKFEKTFNFAFRENVTSIIAAIKGEANILQPTNRNTTVAYE